jgi:DNA invertase Pin-like site-specific DNA recombinase
MASPNKGPKQRKAGIYARVSTTDKGQDPETQLRELRMYVERREFYLEREFVDFSSGRREDRPNYQRLLEAARRREIDVVVVWRYDRFARSTHALVNALKEFKSLGVDFISVTEQTDTTTPQGEFLFNSFANIAQLESALISERVRSGMARAKSQGKHIARPRIPVSLQHKIRDLAEENRGVREIHRLTGVPFETVRRYVLKFKQDSASTLNEP